MKINNQDVEQVALLSHLELSEAQIGEYQNIFTGILNHAQVLAEANTQEIEPTINVCPLENAMRKDETAPSLARETALALSAAHEDGYFKVAKIMES
ncbi:MAG: Asp-tRNA(Asn)/Glu-tRNA(Gln) amidotransferase subunit GatC [Sporomusaceae bacterium]|nr:Asp-tRNA(Asn)/Glu-tRNA(Gln) amidotransferase subunit GatC [Sporomusaceae bacterium]